MRGNGAARFVFFYFYLKLNNRKVKKSEIKFQICIDIAIRKSYNKSIDSQHAQRKDKNGRLFRQFDD